MNNSRNALFENNKDTNPGGLYDGWSAELISKITVPDRSVFYDSNIAFTDGTYNVSSNPKPKTVPNLYETLNGLNDRIQEIHEIISDGIGGDTNITNNEISTADAYLYVSSKDTDTVIMPGNGSADPSGGSIANGRQNGDNTTLTLDATNIRFTVGAQTYNLGDIFNMIKELDARTIALKTPSSVKRTLETSEYTENRFALTTNVISEN